MFYCKVTGFTDESLLVVLDPNKIDTKIGVLHTLLHCRKDFRGLVFSTNAAKAVPAESIGALSEPDLTLFNDVPYGEWFYSTTDVPGEGVDADFEVCTREDGVFIFVLSLNTDCVYETDILSMKIIEEHQQKKLAEAQ